MTTCERRAKGVECERRCQVPKERSAVHFRSRQKEGYVETSGSATIKDPGCARVGGQAQREGKDGREDADMGEPRRRSATGESHRMRSNDR